MKSLSNPSAWQAEMDRQGVQTVLQFHWWGNTRDLIQYLVHDSRWALVYYDETSVLFVRRAGNEEVISRALEAFTAEREKMERSFIEPIKSWQWPMGRAYALDVYSNLLDMIGKNQDAQRFRDFRSQMDLSTRK